MTKTHENSSAKYLSDRRWGPIRFTRSDIMGGEKNEIVYLSRWVWEFGKGRSSIRFHLFRNPDVDRCEHDHPWWFATFVLWGAYVEKYTTGSGITITDGTVTAISEGETKERTVRWFGYRPRGFRHCITRLLRNPTATIIVTGPIVDEWGFYTNRGWVNWKIFVNQPFKKRLFWCSTENGRG